MIFSYDGTHRLLFIEVPEAKTVKNLMHLDLHVGVEQRAARVEQLVSLGAKILYESAGATRFTMADPGGNEFCAA
jgi:hypothetical protein